MKTRMRDGSGHRHYRYILEHSDRHGNVRVYFRRPGQPFIRLRSTPGTDEFDREYQIAFSGDIEAPKTNKRAPAATSSLQWLCEQYYSSAGFQLLDPQTQRVRRRILESICAKAGTFRYALMEPQHVAKLRDEKAMTPEAANSRVKALRSLFKWACSPEYRHATRNPAKDVGYLKPLNPDGHRTWTDADVEKFEKRHPIGTKARLALDLFLYTGVRISDVVKLGPQMERTRIEIIDGEKTAVQKLVFTETKGASRQTKIHELPILPALRASIDATPTGHLVYLPTAFGKPHSVKGFGNWFKRQCRLAGLDDNLSAHGIRKLDATQAAERGATELQLNALFGWTTSKQSGVYTRKARRSKLEGDAAPLLERRS